MKKKQTTVALSDDTFERLDRLVPYLESIPEVVVGGPPSRGTVMRLALIKGLELLERQARESGFQQPGKRRK